ncbi:MAG: ceramidase, partial [bacterium]|nr:ceramidase [bacterium]
MKRYLTRRTAAIVFSGLASVVVMLAMDPIAQDPRYHDFADQRQLVGIPHFGDVVSNLLFVVVGILGLRFLHQDAHRKKTFAHRSERPAFYVFFGGVLLTGIGSGWYHLAPDNPTLVWDRLPMTLAF